MTSFHRPIDCGGMVAIWENHSLHPNQEVYTNDRTMVHFRVLHDDESLPFLPIDNLLIES